MPPIAATTASLSSRSSNSRAAEIATSVDGRFVYASNRGHDSIAVFAIDAASGRLAPIGWTTTGGKTPRFFALGPADRFLFAANEDSDTVTMFARDAGAGTLVAISRIVQIGSPVCIMFKPA
jgi:6-phosphogluconolactonase (cycloisomerase 2 family)